MKKFNLPINLTEDEDSLRELDSTWNEPQKQRMNGGEFNKRGQYFLDWDCRDRRGSDVFRKRRSIIEGLIEKNVGKGKFDDIYSKICQSGFADEPMYGGTVREDFLDYFNNKDRYGRSDYFIDEDGIIQKSKTYRKPKVRRDIYIHYDKPEYFYKVNHQNLESIQDSFILKFGYKTYYHLQSVEEISKDEYDKYLSKWNRSDCTAIMESTRRARNYKPRYYNLYEDNNLFRFIFSERYVSVKEILRYGTKKYLEYRKAQKRKPGINYLSQEKKDWYDAHLKWYKKFNISPKINFADAYNYEFCNKPLPETPDERRDRKGKSRWKKTLEI